MTCADGPDCTTRQSNTHVIEARQIQYRWHAWYGRSVWIYEVVERSGELTVRCGDDQVKGQRRLEVPQWMFDAATCHAFREASTPAVDCEALLELKALLAGSMLEGGNAVGHAGHFTLPRKGSAHAPVAKCSSGRTTAAVSPNDAQPVLEAVAGGDPATHGAAAGKDAARVSRSRRLRPSNGGGR